MTASLNNDLENDDQTFGFHQNRNSCSLSRFHIIFSELFFVIGKKVATHKSHVILIPILLTLLGATGFQQLKYENDPELLFSPTTGESWGERKLIEEYFTVNYSHSFSISRFTRRGRLADFIITSKDGGSILRKIIYEDLLELDKAVKNITVQDKDETFSYGDICAITNGACYENIVLNVYDVIVEVENNLIELLYPVNVEPFILPHFFGGIKTREDGQVLDFATAVHLLYYVHDGTEDEDYRGFLWEQEILKFMSNKTFKSIDVAWFTSRSIEDEMEKNTMSIVAFAVPTLVLATFFILASGLMSDWVRSKPVLGLIGVLVALFSTITAFGLLMYCGAPFIGINLAAPFLTLGIGLDDTFVMLAAWRRTNLQDAVPQRLAQAYSEAAVSITVTSLTDMLSFYTGLLVPFPAIQIFCLYAGTAVLFTYIWHITLFGGCLAIAGYAEEKQRHSIICIKVWPKSQSDSKPFLYRVLCAGGINKMDPSNERDNRPHAIMQFFRDYVAKFINNSIAKTFIILAFLAYLGGALYGCTKLKEGLEMKKLSRDDSYSVDFYEAAYKYFRIFPYSVQVVITGDVTYSDPQTKIEFLNLIKVIESQPYVNKTFSQSVISSWYNYLDVNEKSLQLNITDEESFIYYLREIYLSSPNEVFNQDLVFNEDYTKIIASRMIVQAYELWETNDDKIAMEGLRKIARNSHFNVTVFNQFYIFFDQFVFIRPVTMQAVAASAVAMVVVSLIFIPNPWCSLCIGLSIVSIEIGVVGYMAMWQVSLDPISMLVLIMCIGFSVDFSAHISHTYLTTNADSPEEKVRRSLFNLGFPIIQGGMSTVLSVITFVFAPSYIFKTFFKIVFLVILFGMLHGIFLLPALLSMIDYGTRKNRHNLAQQNAIPTIELPRPSLSSSTDESGKKVDSFCLSYETNCIKNLPSNTDRDMGLGTSGEDSSENSSIELPRICYVNGQLRKVGISTENNKIREQCASALYCNRGYMSDTEAEDNYYASCMSSNDQPCVAECANHHRSYSNRDLGHRRQTGSKMKRYKSYSISRVSKKNPYV